MRQLLSVSALVATGLFLFACGDDTSTVIERDSNAADAGVTADTGVGTDSDAAEDTGNQTLDISVGDDSGTSTDAGPVEPQGSCTDIITCVNTNECADAACLNACIALGSTAAQSQIQALLGCIQTECADATTEEAAAECQIENCGAELSACTGQAVGVGDSTCEDTFSCVLGCTTEACASECVAQGTPAAQTQVAALTQCVATACTTATSEAQLLACAEENCGEQYNACFEVTEGSGEGSGGGSGEGTGEGSGM